MLHTYENFQAVVAKHWCVRQQPALYIQGAVYVDDRQQYFENGTRLSCNDFCSEAVQTGMHLTGRLLTWQHAKPLGEIIHDFYGDLWPASKEKARHIVAWIPFVTAAAWEMISDLFTEHKAFDLSLTHAFASDTLPDGTYLSIKKTLEVGVDEEGKGNRPDCNIHYAQVLNARGAVLNDRRCHVPRGEKN